MLWFGLAFIICVILLPIFKDNEDVSGWFFVSIIIFIVAIFMNLAMIRFGNNTNTIEYNYKFTNDNHVIFKNKVYEINEIKTNDKSMLVINKYSSNWVTVFSNTEYIVYVKK